MNFWSNFYILVLLLWMSLSTYLYVCQYHHLCACKDCEEEELIVKKEPVVKDNSSSTPVKSLRVFYKKNIFIEFPEDIKYKVSEDRALFTKKNKLFIDSIRLYLEHNPNKMIEILGLYSPKEKNNSNLANLGLSRASKFGELINSKKISEIQILLQSEETKFLFQDTATMFYGGLRFEIIDLNYKKTK